MNLVPTVSRRLRRVAWSVAVVAVAITAAVVVSPSGGRTIEAATDGFAGAGGEFHAVAPDRIFSTREAPPLDVEPLGPKPSGPASDPVEFQVPLLGVGDIPADDVLAVAANITIAGPTERGHVRAYPTGSTPTVTSIANFKAGQTVANSVILRPGDDGTVTLRLVTQQPGIAHVLIDVSGFWSADGFPSRGARVKTVDPFRVYNTGDLGGTLNGPETATIPIRGVGPVPDLDSVIGVIVNVTGDNTYGGSRQTRFSVVPDAFDQSDPDDWPSTSNLNLARGQRRANSAVVPIGDDGSIRLFAPFGEVRGIVDITGYLQLADEGDSSRAGRVVPLVAPFRSLNTRLDDFYDQPLGPASAEAWSFDAFVNDVKVGGEWVGPQQGLFGNLTAVDLARQYSWVSVTSFLAAYPAGAAGDGECKPVPKVSNVNLVENEAVPNLALLRYGGDNETPHRLCIFNRGGYVDYILDVYAVVLDDEA